MADVLFVALTIAFFALAAAFVHACDRIVGTDEAPVSAPGSVPEERAAA
jgi:hypothetical protein